jgi:hypothetical protein
MVLNAMLTERNLLDANDFQNDYRPIGSPGSGTSAAPASSAQRAVMTADDMNWSLPGFMGGRQDLMPNLNRFAPDAHRFVNNRCDEFY